MGEKQSLFEGLFLPHWEAAYNLARWIVHEDQDAQDVVQEAYVRAFKSFSAFRGSNPRAWLLTIVRNTAYSWIKRHWKEHNLVPFDETIHRQVPTDATASESCQEVRKEQLEAALNRDDLCGAAAHGKRKGQGQCA
jgi:RNA polymerase sigma factor (sigma-70 family)